MEDPASEMYLYFSICNITLEKHTEKRHRNFR